MSFEALLLLALFVLLPVIEQLIARARRREAVVTETKAAAKPQVITSLPAAPALAAPAAPEPVPERPPRQLSSPRRSRTGARTRRERLRRRDVLREGIVVRIILGPCKALDSGAPSRKDGTR
jgi:hypothetical protein